MFKQTWVHAKETYFSNTISNCNGDQKKQNYIVNSLLIRNK